MAKTDRLSEYVKEEPILWHDRRRYLGLPISFTRYSFDSNKFYLKRGLFNTTSDEVLLYRVLDIRLKRSIRMGLNLCKKIDVTNVGAQYDLTALLLPDDDSFEL